MRVILILVSLFLIGCSPTWKELPYEVYYIDGTKTLGYSLGEGAYIGRIDEPKYISSNAKYISVYACPENSCSYFYIDKVNDHKFAEHNEFVFGPYTKEQFSGLESKFGLPQLKEE
ncbi:hypothetical protein [Pseudocolwellia agarivorans]|uniref:hypothetical protein n=1 Tax=Pseudocolwellia agarivorans TaxID=1911682 RepID=UPI0009870F14|nr:hypothetical protein [Pseudocolwellia agarivorans]